MLTSGTLYCTKGGLTYLPLWKDVTLSIYKIGTCIHQHFLYSISRKCCTIYDHINYFRRFPFFSTLKTPSSTKHEFVQTSQSPNMGHWVHMTRNCGYGETIFGFTNLLTPNFVVGFCNFRFRIEHISLQVMPFLTYCYDRVASYNMVQKMWI